MLFDPEIHDIAEPPFLHPAKRNDSADAGIHGKKALQGKETKPLGDFSLLELFLEPKPPARLFLAQTLSDRLGN
jgi:hypothetical protein